MNFRISDYRKIKLLMGLPIATYCPHQPLTLLHKRVVFNIHGNKYRLIVDIEYRLQIIFIVWTGTHNKYDKIDAKKVVYVKTD